MEVCGLICWRRKLESGESRVYCCVSVCLGESRGEHGRVLGEHGRVLVWFYSEGVLEVNPAVFL